MAQLCVFYSFQLKNGVDILKTTTSHRVREPKEMMPLASKNLSKVYAKLVAATAYIPSQGQPYLPVCKTLVIPPGRLTYLLSHFMA